MIAIFLLNENLRSLFRRLDMGEVDMVLKQNLICSIFYSSYLLLYFTFHLVSFFSLSSVKNASRSPSLSQHSACRRYFAGDDANGIVRILVQLLSFIQDNQSLVLILVELFRHVVWCFLTQRGSMGQEQQEYLLTLNNNLFHFVFGRFLKHKRDAF